VFKFFADYKTAHAPGDLHKNRDEVPIAEVYKFFGVNKMNDLWRVVKGCIAVVVTRLGRGG